MLRRSRLESVIPVHDRQRSTMSSAHDANFQIRTLVPLVIHGKA